MGNTDSYDLTSDNEAVGVSEPLYHVWFRHEGTEPMGDDRSWRFQETSRNTLRMVQNAVGENRITHLKLEENLPANIHNVAPYLTHLCVTSMPPTDIQNVPSSRTLHDLTVLYLPGCDLSSAGIPPNLLTLSSLKELQLSNCRLSALPGSLYELKCLEKLDVSENDLSSDGAIEVISSLTSLNGLQLRNCKLKYLPRGFSRLNQLQELDVSENFLSPDSDINTISTMALLKNLYMRGNKLRYLPQSISHLTHLETLDLQDNLLTDLPSPVCSIKTLKRLKLTNNKLLQTLDNKILQMTSLEDIELTKCDSLKAPPYLLCKRGLNSILQYYKDMMVNDSNETMPRATVAVIGRKLAGKTSLVRTLQSKAKKRILTNRALKDTLDEATKVFKFEEVNLGNMIIKFIDLGGHEVYHLTYQLTLRHNCIPLIVVNIEEFKDLTEKERLSNKETVRRLFLDWMSQLYLASPELGPPKLVITHKDKVETVEFDRLKTTLLSTADELVKEILEEDERLKSGNFSKMKYFCQANHSIFTAKDVYEIGGEDDGYATFQKLKDSLHEICAQDFIETYPKSWGAIEEELQALPGCFISFKDLLKLLNKKRKVKSKEQLQIVLMFMHDCGKIFWYNEIESLSQFVFHKIDEVTALMNVIFHHNDQFVWEGRLNNFQPFRTAEDKVVDKIEYEELLKSFKETGAMSRILLTHLMKTETNYKNNLEISVGLALLKTFRLLYGPQKIMGTDCFVIPYFSSGYQGDLFESNYDVKLAVELNFQGLSLPHYAYHQMTVGLLELFPKETDTPSVRQNGITVYHDESTIKLTHDVHTRKALIEIDTRVTMITESWANLIQITNNTIKHISHTWKASRTTCISYCSHCFLKGSQHPFRTINPSWSSLSTSTPEKHGLFHRLRHKEMVSIVCRPDSDVPRPLKFPCLKPLSKSDIRELKAYVDQKKAGRQAQIHDDSEPIRAEVPIGNGGTPATVPPESSPRGSNLSQQKDDQTEHLPQGFHLPQDEEPESDISDGEGYLYPTDDYSKKAIRIARRSTRVRKIKRYFNNSNKVYRMSVPIRGRALIINNNDFNDKPSWRRDGSKVDVENMKGLLEALKYEVIIADDLEAEAMLTTLRNETKISDHADYGMFVLVIMSHGAEKDLIYGSDGKAIDLLHVYDLLSPLNFPQMAEKPKLVIIQACGGGRMDYGNQGVHNPPSPLTPEVVYLQNLITTSEPTEREIRGLNVDHLLVMKASFESYKAIRHVELGSLFIRCFVATLYKHANHRDVYSLYRIIQDRVRELSKKLAQNAESRYSASGQVVVAIDTLTNQRKLYLFPGYNGSDA